MTEPKPLPTELADAVGEIEWIDRPVPLADLGYPPGPQPSRAVLSSIRQIGVLTPVLLAGDDSGDPPYQVIDGARRIIAAKEVGLETIPARVAALEPDVVAMLTLICNQQRSANPVAETGAVDALHGANIDETEVARLTGMPVQTIRKRLRTRQLLAEWLALFESGDLSTALAEELAKLPDGEQREAYHRWNVDGEKLTHNLLQEVRSVRRGVAVHKIMPALGELPARSVVEVSGFRPSLGPMQRTFRELTELQMKLPDVESMRTAGRLLGELEGQIRAHVMQSA